MQKNLLSNYAILHHVQRPNSTTFIKEYTADAELGAAVQHLDNWIGTVNRFNQLHVVQAPGRIDHTRRFSQTINLRIRLTILGDWNLFLRTDQEIKVSKTWAKESGKTIDRAMHYTKQDQLLLSTLFASNEQPPRINNRP